MIMQRRYSESIALLDELFGQPFIPKAEAGLGRAARLLRELGDPHRSFRAVHVAGSTGKGSTTTLIGSVLQASGRRTGYFRSPHLQSYTERIAVNGFDITQDDWGRAFDRVWPIVEAMRENRLSGYSLGRPTFFEVVFALAPVHFQSVGVEWAAVETGMGGRLDATNLLQPEVAVLTNVSLEHTQVLGTTTTAIAREKAAILKPGSSSVTAAEDPDALEVIERRARDVSIPLRCVGRDIQYQSSMSTLGGQQVDLESDSLVARVNLQLVGYFQAVNAATAFGAVLALVERGERIGLDAIVRGLESVRMPGRFEVLCCDPLIIVDGAHNAAAAQELRRAIDTTLKGRRIVLMFGAMADKNIASMAGSLAPVADLIVLTPAPGTERAASPEVLASAFSPFSGRTSVEADPDRAIQCALSALDSHSALVVAGSLYLAGYTRTRLLESIAKR